MTSTTRERLGCLPWTALIVSTAFNPFSLALLSAVIFIIHVGKLCQLCVYGVPFVIVWINAPHPASHTSALLMCVFIALIITSMAPALPAITLLSAVNPVKMSLHCVVMLLLY